MNAGGYRTPRKKASTKLEKHVDNPLFYNIKMNTGVLHLRHTVVLHLCHTGVLYLCHTVATR